jgi:hypothetical protein
VVVSINSYSNSIKITIQIDSSPKISQAQYSDQLYIRQMIEKMYFERTLFELRQKDKKKTEHLSKEI